MKEKAPDNENEAPAKSKGSMLPLIIALVAMPLVAFAMTKFLIIPQLQASLGHEGNAQQNLEHHEGDSHSTGAHDSGDSHGGGHGESAAGSNLFMMEKILVNVKNTNASRYLVVSFAITGQKSDLKDLLKAKEPMIRDAALGILMNFEIEDLAQVEMKNRAKAMMVGAFNNTLGGEYIDNIFFTEWAVQ